VKTHEQQENTVNARIHVMNDDGEQNDFDGLGIPAADLSPADEEK
jgi:hypothetical protein